jgi:hypothetical protein
MKLSFFSNHLFLLVGLGMKMANAQSCDRSWTCYPTDSAPTLDANHTDWADVEGYTSDLINSNTGELYDVGTITAKCMYDSENIYFALEIPGEYRFNSTDDHLCAAIGFMFQMGPDATYSNMGGCPQAMLEGSCVDGVPDVCESYKVRVFQ